MQFDTTIEDMSNHELSNAISRKKAVVKHKQLKGEDAKSDEMNLCYLQREMQLRTNRKTNRSKEESTKE